MHMAIKDCEEGDADLNAALQQGEAIKVMAILEASGGCAGPGYVGAGHRLSGITRERVGELRARAMPTMLM